MDPLTLGIIAFAILIFAAALVQSVIDSIKGCAATVLIIMLIVWVSTQIRCG